MIEGVRCVEMCCNIEVFSVNPQKTTITAFTNKKTLVNNIRFFNRVLSCSENVKYLGVFLTPR